MQNAFFSLPVPASGPGAAVSVMQMGRTKTLVIDGTFDDGALHVEIANDLAGAVWAPLSTFNGPRVLTLDVAARWMRAVAVGLSGAVTAAVGGSTAGTQLVELVSPATDGDGAQVDTSMLPSFRTVVVDGPFEGAVFIETSENGTDFFQALAFYAADSARQQSAVFYGTEARVRREGDGAPSVWMGAANSEGTGFQSSAGNNFVFRPGGIAAGNVYTDWATLVAALPSVQGFKTIQFDDSIVTPIFLPAGVWDMLQVEWMGVPRLTPGPAAQQLGADVVMLDGASFPNLRQIGGDLQIENGNTVNAPIVIPATGALIEIGESAFGVFSDIINAGAAPFIDASALVTTTNGGQLVLRLRGSIRGGGSPAIQFGAAPAGIRGQLSLSDGASISAGMIGNDPLSTGQIVRVLTTGSGSGIGGQQVTFSGFIDHLRPSNGPTAVGLLRRFYVPVNSANGALLPPSSTPIATGNGLGMNTVMRFDTTAVGGVAQTLPLIRADAPATGAGINTAGVLDSTSLIVTIKNEIGGNNVTVSPSIAEIPPDTIEGAAFPVTVPPGGSRTFMSDGISNWIIVDNYLGNPSPVYVVTNPVTNRAFDTTTVLVQGLAEVVGTMIDDLRARGILG